VSQPKKTLTVGTPWRVILLFTVPLLIGNIVQQMYHVIDAVVVGQSLGVNSLAAVGVTGSLLFLFIGFAWGMTSGFAIPTAQAYGGGNYAAVRRSVAAGTILTAGISLLLTVSAPFLAEPLLRLMRTPTELLPEATTFAVISFLGAASTMFFNYLSAIIRAIGDARTPLIFLIVSCVLNIALVVLFVSIMGHGVGGAAFATVLAQLGAVIGCFWYLKAKLPVLHVERKDWKVSYQELSHHLRIGVPMGFQASIIAIGTVVVQVKLNEMGSEAVAAYTAATRVDGLAVAFLASLGLAVSTFVAQNYGARQFGRIRQGVRQSLVMATIGSIVLAVTLIAAGSPIVRMFVGDAAENVVSMAHWYLVVNGVLYFTLGLLFVLRGALQGLGRTFVPMMTGVTELVGRVGAAIILGSYFGFSGIVWGNPIAWIAAVVLLWPAWRRALRDIRSDELAFDLISTENAPVVAGVSEAERAAAASMTQAESVVVTDACEPAALYPDAILAATAAEPDGEPLDLEQSTPKREVCGVTTN
jgi:putative MATE family efflux protein